MAINKGIRELWKLKYFEEYRKPSEIKDKIFEKFGITSSNITAHLRSCSSFLRKEKEGWIQKDRYLSGISSKHTPKISEEIDLFNLNLDPLLLKACKTNYNSKDYWDMALMALRHLEVRTRKKAKLSASDIGANLMEKTFKPSVGILKIPGCATSGEEDGFKQIVKGMMLFHRNAKGHREENIDKDPALKIVGYIDYLIKKIDSAAKR